MQVSETNPDSGMNDAEESLEWHYDSLCTEFNVLICRLLLLNDFQWITNSAAGDSFVSFKIWHQINSVSQDYHAKF